jgi:FixJ family two-component response regulator
MIYLLDDDKSVRRAFEMFLKSADQEFKSYGNAKEFLSGFKPGTDDIVVLDLNLPGMDGRELLKLFIHQNISTPVIVVTANDDPKVREYCREYGVKAFLRKPVDGEALIDLIRYNISK